KDPVGLSAHKAAAIYDIGKAIEYRLQQYIVFIWVIFQVRILNDNPVACGFLIPGTKRSTLALVHGVAIIGYGQVRIGSLIGKYRLLRIVPGAVVHNDYFLAYVIQDVHRLHLIEDMMNRRTFI